MVIYLERGADLHTARLMSLLLTVSCFSKIRIRFTFLVPAHPGSPGKRAVKRMCVCYCVCGRRARRSGLFGAVHVGRRLLGSRRRPVRRVPPLPARATLRRLVRTVARSLHDQRDRRVRAVSRTVRRRRRPRLHRTRAYIQLDNELLQCRGVGTVFTLREGGEHFMRVGPCISRVLV